MTGRSRAKVSIGFRLLPDGPWRIVRGREASTLWQLIERGSKGLSGLESGATRLAAYVHDLRHEFGLEIEAKAKLHGGPFAALMRATFCDLRSSLAMSKIMRGPHEMALRIYLESASRRGRYNARLAQPGGLVLAQDSLQPLHDSARALAHMGARGKVEFWDASRCQFALASTIGRLARLSHSGLGSIGA